MNPAQIRALIELVSEIVHAEGLSWQEKHTLIVDEMSDSAEQDFAEFMSWFDA